jgi:hypothetical protein
MTSSKIKKLLAEVADEIRLRNCATDDEEDVVVTLAAVVEHMDPDTLKPAK